MSSLRSTLNKRINNKQTITYIRSRRSCAHLHRGSCAHLHLLLPHRGPCAHLHRRPCPHLHRRSCAHLHLLLPHTHTHLHLLHSLHLLHLLHPLHLLHLLHLGVHHHWLLHHHHLLIHSSNFHPFRMQWQAILQPKDVSVIVFQVMVLRQVLQKSFEQRHKNHLN